MEVRLPPYTPHLTLQTAAAVGERVPWSISDYGISAVWDAAGAGEGVLVGVVDTGCSLQHPDLKDAIVGTYGGRWRTGEDYNGHGSHVCGTIAARQNQTGVVGVAPKAKLFVAKGLGKDGSGSDQDIANAIDACTEAGCHLLNMSLGSPQESMLITAALNRAVRRGVLPICAAGNEGPGTQSWPAMLDIVGSVAAIDRDRRVANFSTANDAVDVSGPGVQILSTYKNGTYATLSGTSMASPWMTGLAALVTSYELRLYGERRTVTASQFIELVRTACDDLGRKGRDPETGYGVPIPSRLFTEKPQKPVVEPSGFDWSGLVAEVIAVLFRKFLGGK